MNETPVAKKLTSTEARLVRINKDGAPELAKAVKDGLIGNWTATHMIVEKWPLTLQAMVADVMRDEKAKAAGSTVAIEKSKAVAAAGMKKTKKVKINEATGLPAGVNPDSVEVSTPQGLVTAADVTEAYAKKDGITVGPDGKVDMNVKPTSFKKGKKVKAVKPTAEQAFEASVAQDAAKYV